MIAKKTVDENPVDPEIIKNYSIEAGPMGPIGEGEALILRVNRNCPWNKCLFCPVYKGKKFSRRDVTDIRRDIDAIQRIAELIEKTSWNIGLSGRINQGLIQEVVRHHPEIYRKESSRLTHDNYLALMSLNNVANWLLYGAKRVFLQDANALGMRPGELIDVLKYLKDTFPTVQTVTCYARSKTCARRSLEEFRELKEAGLSWLFVGIESGCDDLLQYMKKGVNSREHIAGGQAVKEVGINLAAFVMPGLAGNNMELAQRHVSETIKVLNEVGPTEVRIRSLAIIEGSPLYASYNSGEFEPPTDDQMIDEIRMLLEGLRFDCTFEAFQMTNVLFNTRGTLSATREELLAKIGNYQALSPIERSRFRFNRYLSDGYLDCVQMWGKLDQQLGQLIEEAQMSLKKESPDATAKTEEAIFAIKSKGIP